MLKKIKKGSIDLLKRIYWLFSLAVARVFMKKTCSDYNKRYIIILGGIGDFLYALGFLRAYKRYCKEKEICVIVPHNKVELLELYQDEPFQYMSMSNHMYKVIKRVTWSVWGTLFLKKQNNISLMHPGLIYAAGVGNVSKIPNVNSVNIMKYADLELPENAVFSNPVIPKVNIDSIIKEYNLQKQKTVVLCPFANTIKEIEVEFYQELTIQLTEKGFKVIVNTPTNTNYSIVGAQNVDCTMKELASLANYCGYVVGVRSGALDYLHFSEAKLVALYPYGYDAMPFVDINVIVKKEEKKEYLMKNDLEIDIEAVKHLLDL